MTDQAYDASNPEHVTKRRTKAQRREERRIDDFKSVMSSPQGRRFVWWLMEQAHVFKQSFAGPGLNDQTNFNEGMRAIGNMVLADVHRHCAHQYVPMVQENAALPD